MSKRPGKNKNNLEETHKVFLAIARQEFTNHGYADASTSRIVQESGMARGSLYYHFGDKNGLFKAVYEEMMFEGLNVISNAIDTAPTKWDAIKNGSQAFLDLCLNEEYRKITLIEAQSAITFKERYQIHEKTILTKLRQLLPELLEKGYFSGHTEETIPIFILGMLSEIGRTMDSAQDIIATRKLFGDAFDATLKMMEPQNNKSELLRQR